MRNVPRYWVDIKLLDCFHGKYVVIARKSGATWYLAGINSQAEIQRLILDLSMLNLGANGTSSHIPILITNGNTNRSFIQKAAIIRNNKLDVEIKPNGGFVVVL